MLCSRQPSRLHPHPPPGSQPTAARLYTTCPWRVPMGPPVSSLRLTATQGDRDRQWSMAHVTLPESRWTRLCATIATDCRARRCPLILWSRKPGPAGSCLVPESTRMLVLPARLRSTSGTSICLAFPPAGRMSGTARAFRGEGQAFRLEAIPGNRVQRYLVSFTEPYLFWTPISLNVSGFLYDRGLLRLERVACWRTPRLGIPSDARPFRLRGLADGRSEDQAIRACWVLRNWIEVLGSNDFYSGQFSLRHDTRDLPFAPTEGHLIELNLRTGVW